MLKMRRYMLICGILGVIFSIYALDHGIYVGSKRYVWGAPCCPQTDTIRKRCRYLFVTGISEIDARDGEIDAPNATSDDAARAAALAKPENGYCRLFGS